MIEAAMKILTEAEIIVARDQLRFGIAEAKRVAAGRYTVDPRIVEARERVSMPRNDSR